jgi:mono/diheme cytochrome c family protein
VRIKTLGVFTVMVMALFTALYWLTDAPRRDAEFQAQQAELVELGMEYFGPDNITYTVTISPSGFEPAEVEIEVNATVQFTNTLGSDVTVNGTGAHPFAVTVKAGANATTRFQSDGVTTATADGVAGSVVVTAGPEFLNPAAANCARCHGANGEGGPIGNTGVVAPNLHSRSLADKWQSSGGAIAKDGQPAVLNNYVHRVIRYGGVMVSGNTKSIMPAWGQDAGGVLTVEQIDALTAMIGTWLDETLQQPVEEVPDTVEAGAQVYVDAQCATCHGVNLEGGVGPNLQNIGSEPVTDLPTPISGLDQLVADYEADPRSMLEKWIRDSATNYNDGAGTGMPPHPEGSLSEQALRALITFLLDQTQ